MLAAKIAAKQRTQTLKNVEEEDEGEQQAIMIVKETLML